MKKEVTKKVNKNLTYEIRNPKTARILKRAVKRGLKEYAETFKRLATT